MLQKGSMRPVKKILGWAIIGIGAMMVLNFNLDIILKYKLIVGIALIVLGYLNIKAGTQL